MRQLAALLATFTLGLGLVVVAAEVAPGSLRIASYLPDGAAPGSPTATSEEPVEPGARAAAGESAARGAPERAGGRSGDVGGEDPQDAGADASAEPDDAESPDASAEPDVSESAESPDASAEPDVSQSPDAPAEPDVSESPDVPETVERPDGPAPSAAAAAPSSSPDGTDSALVLELVNAERAAVGCGALRADAGLDDLALRHSEDMAARGYFAHTTPDGLTPWDRAAAAGVQGAAAENIARGQQDAAEVVRAWMDSPGHRANIVNCELTRHGLGAHRADGGPWWTQVFGR
ncbi:hypothetical protein GCM10009718_11160 [Isoptericola halotolerans]